MLARDGGQYPGGNWSSFVRALVLDQSTQIVGWCVVEDDPTRHVGYGANGRLVHPGGRITTTAGGSVGTRVASILLDVAQIIKAYQVKELVIEETGFIVQKSAKTNYALTGLKWELEKLAGTLGLKFYCIPIGKVKALATGSGKADKDQMIAGAANYWGKGIKILDHNHADALCGGMYWLANGPEMRQR